MIAVIPTLQTACRLRSGTARAVAVLWIVVSSLAAALPGAPDATFGSGFGTVITPIGSGTDVAYSLALQPDGMFVVAGTCSNGTDYDFCLARYLANGALDTNFNGIGKVLTTIGNGNDGAYSVALQPDGKIVVSGSCLNGTTYDFCLARYLASGALDLSFNGSGKVMTAIGSGTDAAYSVALQPDGKIVVAGRCSNGTNTDFCLARYLASGALDVSLNSTGTVITTIGSGGDIARGVALQPDGKIVVAGYCSNGTSSDFCLARYLASGTLDVSFNGSGTVITPIGVGDDYAISLALQPDGKIIVSGVCSNGANSDFCLARYLANGTLDTNFNSTGKVITPIGNSDDYGYSVALQPDDKIVVAGYCSNGTNFDFCLARYLANGTLDTSFNSTGKVITAIGSGNDVANSAALQPDGKIVVAGFCSNGSNDDFCLARYDGGPNTPKTLTEYIYNPLNYYFLTSRDTEKAALDALPGWARTGQSFSTRSFADPGALGISRYYFDQIAKNQTRGSHFYTLVDSEKTALAALNPNNQASPRLPYYEGIDSYAFLPVIEGVGGSCAAGQVPVYRAFRGQTRFPDDPNHRFTTSLTLYNQLVAQGWDGEGVKLCTPN
ncbi:MAG TPA: delta-60 repeat domain-containing protein [Casimicrobium sp.]|nr:delta-60 repeat domain-containing protein [Casimicrobium sp.]